MITRFTAPIAVLILFCALTAARANGAPVRVRHSTAPDTVRVVLDLPREAAFTDQSTPRQVQLTLDLPLAGALPAVTVDDPVVASVTVEPDASGNAQLTVSLHKARKYTVFTLPPQGNRPHRLVVDILKRFRNEETRALSPAITYTRLEQQADDHYRVVHFLEVDTRAPHVRLGVTAARNERERVSAMVERAGAVCGINGGYFMQGTRPVGLLKADGQIFSLPIWGRTAAAFPLNGAPVLGNSRGAWRVTLADGMVCDIPDWLDASVQDPLPDAVVYSGNIFTQSPANPRGLTSLVRGGQVLLCTSDPLPLSPGDFAFRLKGAALSTLDPLLAVGAPVTVAPVLTPTWEAFPHALGAGPRLLRDGKLAVSGLAERFKPDILQGRPARSALGVTARGTVVLVLVEAPGPYGGGATLEELAGLLKSRGAVDALNLDGGGSSTLAIGNTTVNYPPGAWTRPVASGILVYDTRIPPPPLLQEPPPPPEPIPPAGEPPPPEADPPAATAEPQPAE
jgi:exopolysaccharide biosynthesis protein